MLGGLLLTGSAEAATYPLGWGLNGDGQASPVPTNAMSNVTAVAAGYFHSLALKDGRVWSWGSTANGLTNIPLAAQSGVTNIAAGNGFSLALRTNGAVIGWGGGPAATNVPAALTSGVTKISAGNLHALAIHNGGVVAWGDDTYNQSTVPDGLTNDVADVAAGGYYSLALKDGAVTVFGIAATNLEPSAYSINEVPPEAGSNVAAIAAGMWHALALKEDGGVVAWGSPHYDATNVPPEAASGVVAIAAGDCFSIARKTDNTIVVWGDDFNGQTILPAFASNGVSQIAAGKGHCLVVSTSLPPRFISFSTPDAFLDRPYTNTPAPNVFAVGDPAVAYHRVTGGWPPWLTLGTNTGVLGGTPTALGTYNFSIIASNALGKITNAYRVVVVEKFEPPVFVTTNLPGGIVGAPYAQGIVVSNGGTFSITNGSLPAGLTMATDGWISGTPTTVEAPQFGVLVTNAAGRTGRVFQIAVTAPPAAPVFVTQFISNGVLGQPYSFQVETENYPTNFGVVAGSGALPAGLGITAAGTITGTPTVAGTAGFQLFASNMVGGSTAWFSLHVNGPPVFLTPSPLPDGVLDESYGPVQIEADVVNYFQMFGNSPTGLNLSAEGWLSGTPTATGTYTFIVQAVNDFGASQSNYTLTVTDQPGPPEFFTTSPLTNGVLGQAYSQPLLASGNPTFSLESGDLPDGLGLGAGGLLSGTPTNRGSFEFTVRATNSYGWTNRLFALEIRGPPEFGTESPLPTGIVSQAYSVQMEATGDPVFSVWSGDLPDGLALTDGGLLNGTPTLPGTFAFTVRATNAYGWSDRPFALDVVPRTLAVLSRTNVNVRENGEGRFFVKLDEAPAAATTVAVARVAGDADIEVAVGAALVFAPSSWDVWQPVTLAALDDADLAAGTATIHVATAAGIASATAAELDDDIGPNLALASAGTTIAGTNAVTPSRAIDGIHLESANNAAVVWTNAGTLTLDLQSVVQISSVRLLCYDWDHRIQKFRLDGSTNGTDWALWADVSDNGQKGWVECLFTNAPARYLRLTGVSNSATIRTSFAEWEVYGPLGNLEPPVFTVRPRYANGALVLNWTNLNAVGTVQVWMATNLTRSPPPWTNLGVQVSPWTNAAPPMPSYYQLRLAP